MKWFMELIKTIIAYFSVVSKEGSNPEVNAVTDFLGEKAIEIGGVKGALVDLGAELGGATVNEAIHFVQQHKTPLFTMTKQEFSFMFEKIFRKDGKFDEEAYKQAIAKLDEEALVAEAEANADAMQGILESVEGKKAMVDALQHSLSVLARFALAKAISIASHGVI